MKSVLIVAVAAALAAAAWASPPRYELAGGWGYFSHWLNGEGSFVLPHSVAVAPNGNVYGPQLGNLDDVGYVKYFTSTGSLLGSWVADYEGVNGLSTDGKNVFVGAYPGRILVFDAKGEIMGHWGKEGSGDGEFAGPPDVDVAPDGRVFAADTGNHRVQYFRWRTFLGKWGTLGSGPGEFKDPVAIAVSPDGKRVYVADRGNNRIQYFIENVGIAPASLGRVKALFK